MPEKWFWVETEAGYLSIQHGAGTSATEIILDEEFIFREETILD